MSKGRTKRGQQRGQRPNDEFYRLIGSCIYCGSTEGLTDEHAAPRGLQGPYILGKASCSVHSEFTKFIEDRALLSGFLRPIREHWGILGRRRKERPTFYVLFENADRTIERVEVSLEEYPMYLAMPILPPPGILLDRPKHRKFPPLLPLQVYTTPQDQAIMQRLMANDALGRQLYWPLDYGNFTKFLAKIGYCMARFYMREEFEPISVELIVSPRDDDSLGMYYVGNAAQQEGLDYPETPSDRMFTTQVRWEQVGGRRFIIARFRMFPSLNMPIYDAVVGEIANPTAKAT